MSDREQITYAQAAIVMARLAERGEAINQDTLSTIFSGRVSNALLQEYCDKWHKRQQNTMDEPMPISSHGSRAPDQDVGSISEQTKDLEESLALVRATLESTADGILIINNEGQLVDWNEKFIEIMQNSEETMQNRDEGGGIAKLLAKIEDPEEFIQLMQKVYQNPELSGNMGNLKFKDGRIIERYSQPHVINNQIVGRVWSFRDITERVKNHQTLELREKVIDASINGIMIIEAKRPHLITYVNPALAKIVRSPAQEMINQPFLPLLCQKTDSQDYQAIENAINNQQPLIITTCNTRKNGDQYWVELSLSPVPNQEGYVSHHVGVMMDVTEQIKAKKKMWHRANHDYLTNLPNRDYFISTLLEKIKSQPDVLKAVIFVDIDNFKFINDRFGHVYGDQLLLSVTEKLKEQFPDELIARFGGDEFVMLLEDFESKEALIKRANQLLTTINQMIEINGTMLAATASAGISIYPEHSIDINELLINSDIAMYEAKEAGKNQCYLYSDELKNKIAIKMILENTLHTALNENQMFIVFQPIVNLDSKEVIGAESLIRWLHPELGMVSPDKFIPLAELNGEINSIGLWVLDKACKQFSQWHQQFGLSFISVNVSTIQMKAEHFYQQVQMILEKYQLPPSCLELELTEGVLAADCSLVLDNILNLKKLGVKLSIDDFGTGFSNFSYLKRFQIDKIKIDRSFVSNMTFQEYEFDGTICRSIINLGNDLGIKVVAEGIEDLYQEKFLLKNSCHQGQGYYYGKPMNSSEFELVLFPFNRQN